MTHPAVSDLIVLDAGPMPSGSRIRRRKHAPLVVRKSGAQETLNHQPATGGATCKGSQRIVSGTQPLSPG